ncbi:DUF1613-domain-containing protein [Acrodontium crateriforme]|uniref:tRNA (uracil-O(2)-)-methyltransferase n=1 Tax=Acrodontium crateriforme TaxID=150365 RepID=A0AAQ3R204_9PEZI|nr:DUF1613-domain-containing protein [Acrodontium crateriforme]
MANPTHPRKANDERASEPKKPPFQPIDCKTSPPVIHLPNELWLTILQAPCTFPPSIFAKVMLNLIQNPNITSSHLFRADIFYDSGEHPDRRLSSTDLARHLKAEYRPIASEPPQGFELTRTIVRQLVPRNAQLDKALVQTCHFFQRAVGDVEESVVLYIPHVRSPGDVPFYHPEVAKLAFYHCWREIPESTRLESDESLPDSGSNESLPGSVSVSYNLFDGTTMTTKLDRTALRLIQTIHKHGQGQLAGYEKRVHLDQIIPQKRYQDTYATLKAKYGKQLSDQWVEVTDPGKHVFEDIGIAAFLIELWRDMYAPPTQSSPPPQLEEQNDEQQQDGNDTKPPFPGFVDIGCGNGILVHILLMENYPGWGFDARKRKTWSIFPETVQKNLHQRILIPSLFNQTPTLNTETYHNGIFPPGTFIISNHADELTPWTPLLAYMNQSAFIAIPCCSHDLSGARFRAPAMTKVAKAALKAQRNHVLDESFSRGVVGGEEKKKNGQLGLKQASETTWKQTSETTSENPTKTGTLSKPQKPIVISAYATLCSYVSSLATAVGFEPEEEVLRIPSTRNKSIVGRRRVQAPQQKDGDSIDEEGEDVLGLVQRLVEAELERDIEGIGRDWIARAEKLAKKPGSGH